MSYQRGEIVLVPFPFTDLSQQKARPAVVLSPRRFNERSPDVILAAISSRIPATPDEMELVIRRDDPEFAEAGLRVSSVIKGAQLVTMKQSLVHMTLGRIGDRTLRELDERVALALGLGQLSQETAARRVAETQIEELAARVSQLQARLAELEAAQSD